MFDYDYKVALTAVHPCTDLSFLSDLIAELQPEFVAVAGTERLDIRGVSLGRKSKFSVWSAPLGTGEFVDSRTTTLSDFLEGHLPSLRTHADVFRELGKDGEVMLVVDWRGHDTHTAGVISAEVVRECAEIGVGFEINICMK